MKYLKKILISALIIVLYVTAFNNYLGNSSFTDLFNSIFVAAVIFTILFLTVNGLAVYQNRPFKHAWKWILVLVLSSVPYFTWLYVYPWTAGHAYPVFIHYLAEQGKSTQDISQYRAFPDLTQGGYFYEIRLKNDHTYLYDYSVRDGQVLFMIGKSNTFGDYPDAKIQAIHSKLDETDAGIMYMQPVSKKLQRQKLQESQAHSMKLFQIRDIGETGN